LKWLKKIVVKTVLMLLGRALKKAHKVDKDIAHYYEKLPENISFGFEVYPDGPCLSVFRTSDKITISCHCSDELDILFIFKNLEAAFMVFTTKKSTIRAYAENRISVKGDIGNVMYLMRIIDRIQVLLFPKFIAKRVVKGYPDIPWKILFLERIKLFVGILTG
jgi:hypothetical protein